MLSSFQSYYMEPENLGPALAPVRVPNLMTFTQGPVEKCFQVGVSPTETENRPQTGWQRAWPIT